MPWIICTRVIAGTTCRVLAYAQHSTSSLTGCHASFSTGLGVFTINGVQVDGQPKTLGMGIPDNLAWTNIGWPGGHSVYARDLPNPLTPDIVVDMVWEKIATSMFTTVGAVVFSDRVNRGAQTSPNGWCLYGEKTVSAASFARWLAERPQFGPLFSSPVFHNPNHSSRTDFSLCQIWTWFPPARKGAFFVDEAESLGINPDTNLYPKKNVIDHFRAAAGVGPTAASDEALGRTSIVTTYDAPLERNRSAAAAVRRG